VTKLIRFEEHDSSRKPSASSSRGENGDIEYEAEDWDDASQMVRHYLQLAETAMKVEDPAPRKRRRAA
jgi:hypothetical protein